jgi:hypothetical protein
MLAAAVMAYFSRLFQHFASARNTRYELTRPKRTPSEALMWSIELGLFGTILSSQTLFL